MTALKRNGPPGQGASRQSINQSAHKELPLIADFERQAKLAIPSPADIRIGLTNHYFETLQLQLRASNLLREQGVDLAHIEAHVGPPILAPLVFEQGRIRADEYHLDRRDGFVIEVRGEDCDTVEDLAAWFLDDPASFGVMFGRASVLGLGNITNPASFVSSRPCPLWSYPLQLLQHGFIGAVLLDIERAVPLLIQAPGPFIAHAWLADRLLACGMPAEKIFRATKRIARRAAA